MNALITDSRKNMAEFMGFGAGFKFKEAAEQAKAMMGSIAPVAPKPLSICSVNQLASAV